MHSEQANRLRIFALMFAACGGGPGSDDDAGTSGNGTNPAETSTSVVTTGITTAGMDGDADTTTGAATTGAETDTDTSFISRPDAGGVAGMCDVWTQDCPEGEKCTPALVNGGVMPICVPVDGNPGQPGDPCTRDDATGVDSCDVGVLCIPHPDPELMFCYAMCSGSPGAPVCEGDKDICVIADGGATPICFTTCDPLLQDCAVGGFACFPSNGGFICAVDQSGGGNQEGDPCGPALNTCAAGLVCSGAVAGCSDACCTPYCDLGAADPEAACPGAGAGEMCLAVYVDPAPEYANVGVCAVPM